MTGCYCPYRIFGNGTKCRDGYPYREFDIGPSDECMAWSNGRCHLCFPDSSEGAP